MKDLINKIHQADCLEFMKQLEDNSIDCVITDPPYGIGEDTRKADKSGRKEWKSENRWDLAIPPKEYFDEIFRISKHQIIWGGNYFVEYLKNSRCWLSWYKMQEFSGADMELAYTSFDKSSKTYNLSRVVAHNREKKLHPTQKPVELMKWCINHYTEENDLILDPFAGSGSTCVAAQNLHRNFIGIELEEKYCEIARDRLKQQTLI